MYTLNLAYASIWFVSLAATGAQFDMPVWMNIGAGVFGGAISQCVTNDERNPSKKKIVGEMMAAAAMGYVAYATTGTHEPSTIVLAMGLGGGGSLSWSKFVKKYQDWMGK